LKFMDRGNVEYGVKVEKSSEVSTFVFWVKDTGIGIPKDKQSIIFERFQQVDNSTRRQHTGTGLGLTITKSLVELLGGHLWLESELGKGSTFYFSHPLAVVEVDKRASKLTMNPRGYFRTTSSSLDLIPDGLNVADQIQLDQSKNSGTILLKPRTENKAESIEVLLAEDNVINQHVTTMMLKKAGYHVTVVADGLQAIEQFKRGIYDAILMDIQMAIMDGVTATKMIREIEKDQEKSKKKLDPIPIIALTANAMLGDMENYLRQGFDNYLSKPFSKEDLIQLLSASLKQ